eukprot:PhF_6_TR43366/c0_g1_i1/m.66471
MTSLPPIANKSQPVDDDKDITKQTGASLLQKYVNEEYVLTARSNLTNRIEALRAERIRRETETANRRKKINVRYETMSSNIRSEAKLYSDSDARAVESVETVYKETLNKYKSSYMAFATAIHDRFPSPVQTLATEPVKHSPDTPVETDVIPQQREDPPAPVPPPRRVSIMSSDSNVTPQEAPLEQPPKQPRAPPNPSGRKSRPSSRKNSAASVVSVMNDGIEIEPDPIDSDPVFLIWLREHPEATKVEIAREKHRRFKEIAAVERALQQRALKITQDELKQLTTVRSATPTEKNAEDLKKIEEQNESYRKQQSELWNLSERARNSMDTELNLTTRDVEKELEEKQRKEEWDRQKAEWDRLNPTHTVQVKRKKSKVSMRIIEGNEEGTHWVKDWQRRGYKQELAVLKMQQAWRGFIARRIANYRRAMRQNMYHRLLQDEHKREVRWNDLNTLFVLGKLQEIPPMHILEAVRNCAERWKDFVQHKRMLKQLRWEKDRQYQVELAQYAAKRIQALHRGNVARYRVYHLRHPEIKEAEHHRFLNKKASRIQSLIKGCKVRQMLRKKQAAAVVIQKYIRRMLASNAIANAREESQIRQLIQTREYAATLIQRLVRKKITQTPKKSLNRFKLARLLQPIGRAYKIRKVLVWDIEERCEAARVLQRASHMLQAKKIKEKKAAYIQAHLEDQDAAEGMALSIQLAWKRHVARKILAELQSESTYLQQSAAVFVLQNALKIPLAKKELKRRQLVLLLQRVGRAWKARMQIKQSRIMGRDEAATKITRFMRQASAKGKTNNKRSASQNSQMWVIVEEACEVIQRTWRAHRSRMLVSSLKVKRENDMKLLEMQESIRVLIKFWRNVVHKKKSTATK